MSWLVAQLWPVLAVTALLGAVLTTVRMTTVVEVERWVRDDEPAVRPFPVLGELSPTAEPAAAPAPRRSSPFPPLAGHHPDDRPWEAEELWSRPARLAGGNGQRHVGTDAWAEAAKSWRSWADEATGRTFVEHGGRAADDDLFAADREAERLGASAARLPARFDPEHHAGDDAQEDVDDFPFARPVEANG